ncbi:MAG: DUF2157 domain-containing protein [Acidobacteria bacterium]|nr:DUF2157 domain-containing protein [Acidobacteriota bacterium]MBV9475280.1 DUF2157 domain-containing protein [Acidobacteriota bacterium]
MLSFEPELEALRPRLGAVTDLLIARERREIFSIYPELRICAWAGATLLATAAGIVLKDNLDRIGPVALVSLMAVAALVCYAWVWSRRARASLVDDYVLLLGALIVSADVAFIESQFHLLGERRAFYFLLLAIVHGIVAYAYGSRMVLSLSVSAFAAWLGVRQPRMFDLDFTSGGLAVHAFICALALLVWRALDRRWHKQPPEFSRIFEHAAALVALSGAFSLVFENDTRTLGCLLTLGCAAAVIAWGIRAQRESFVLYAFLYAVVAADVLLVSNLHDETSIFFVIVVSTIASIVALFVIHARFRERFA